MSAQRFSGIRRVFRLGVARGELEEELAFHHACTVEELIAGGMTEDAARQEARRRFGDERRWRREIERVARRAEALGAPARVAAVVAEDVRYALRRMRRAPGLTLAVVLTFGLGVGANATMFGILDRILLRAPDHIVEPEAVRRILAESRNRVTGKSETREVFTHADYQDMVGVEAYSGVAAYSKGVPVLLGEGAEARSGSGVMVTHDFFGVLGVRPALGRFFDAEEERVGGDPVVVISHALWRSEFGGDPRVLGRTLDFGLGPHTVIGVAPKGFTGVDLAPVDVWLPLHATQARSTGGTEWEGSLNWSWLWMVGRLAPGATPEEADAQATALHRRRWAERIERGWYDAEARVGAAPLIAAAGANASGESVVARWLAGVSLVVLLIACANIANLLLARAVRQRRETGVRLALGVSRRRLLAQMLTESLVLAALGGVVALLVAHWGGGLLRAVLLPDIAWGETVGGRVLLVSIGLALLAGLAAGLVPAWQASRPDVLEALRSGARGVATPVSRTRGALTVLQAALSVVLLVGAGLFVRSLDRVQALDLGLSPEGVLLVRPLSPDKESDPRKRRQLLEGALERLERLPGVERVAATKGTPFQSSYGQSLHVPGLDSLPKLPGGGPYVQTVSRGYFATLDLRVVRGRGFGPGDREGAPRVVVVNETMARTLWPGEDALGKCLHLLNSSTPCSEVVGVVEDARRFSLVDEERAMQYYVPLEQQPEASPEALLVRTGRELGTLAPALRREVLALDPSVRYVAVQPFEEIIAPQLRSWRLGATMFSVFGGLALLVAAIGLYSVLAFGVAQRTQELGVRAALGATRKRLLGMVMGQGVRLAGVGIACGVGLALLVAPRLEALLYETSPRDPLTLSGVGIALLLVALLASGLPAWRATRVDPSEALRAD